MNKYRILVKGIVQKDNKFLTVQKWYDDSIVEPYKWEFIDGEPEFGEAPDIAVIRIIQEQTGIIADIAKILYTWSFMVGSEYNIGIAYLCLTEQNEEDVILSEDLNDAKWLEETELKDYICNKAMLEDLEKADLF